MLTETLKSLKFDNNFAIIKLTKGLVAIVDIEDFEDLNKHTWQARKSFNRFYAQRKVVTNGREFWIKMHRQLLETPKDMITHHKNRCTMDNRKHNLENMYQKDHHNLHVTKFPGRLLVQKKNGL